MENPFKVEHLGWLPVWVAGGSGKMGEKVAKRIGVSAKCQGRGSNAFSKDFRGPRVSRGYF